MAEQSFTRDPGVETVWVENPDTGGVAELSLAALPFWTGRGWQPMDAPPPEVDPTRAHMAGLTSATEPEPAAEPVSETTSTAEAVDLEEGE